MVSECKTGGWFLHQKMSLVNIGKLVMVTQVRIKWSEENLKDVERGLNIPISNVLVRTFGLIYKKHFSPFTLIENSKNTL